MAILWQSIQINSDPILFHIYLVYRVIKGTAAFSVFQTILDAKRCIVVLLRL